MGHMSKEEVRRGQLQVLQPHMSKLTGMVSDIGGIMQDLDIDYEFCQCCGHKNFNSIPERNLFTKLDQIAKQIKALVNPPETESSTED